ncbi:hypothetical protein ACFLW3_01615 [Chloroflexota bacterium]
MSNLEKAELIAKKLRQEPYNILTNNCFTRSRRLKQGCKVVGIAVRVVACIGLARARLFGSWLTIPVVHGWGEVEGRRVETSWPLDYPIIWGIFPEKVRPLITIRF